MIKMKVNSIGAKALNDDDRLIILFGETVSDRLKEVSVIQKIERVDSYQIKKGMQLKIDDQNYDIIYVGGLVRDNLKTVHHTVLDFEDVPNNPRENAIYLGKHQLPVITVGSQITIQ